MGSVVSQECAPKGGLVAEHSAVRRVRVPRPLRATETRHNPKGRTCHHYQLHGLTCDDYDRLRERAVGCCEICGIPEAETGGKRLIVDHFEDQETQLSFIRGLLCDRCNAVMACMDGMKPWGRGRKYESQAREYEARSWEQPSPEQWVLVEEIRQRRQARLSGRRRQAASAPQSSSSRPPAVKPRIVRISVDSPELAVATLRAAMTDEQFSVLAAAVDEIRAASDTR